MEQSAPFPDMEFLAFPASTTFAGIAFAAPAPATPLVSIAVQRIDGSGG